MTVRILHGDALEQMRTLADESVHSIVTDPPYHLTTGKKGGSGAASDNPSSPAGRARIGTGGGFMGMAWDGGDIAQSVELWIECLRVLKPGGHLLSFGGSRTYHRMACAIEDAGFEIRDQIFYVYGSGFPKSLNLDKERGYAFCGCESDTEHKLPRVQQQDISAPVAVDPRQGALLQQGVSQSSASGPEQLSGAEVWFSESSMEGRGDPLQDERQLRERPLCASASLGESDGTQGRLSDGAPLGNGGVVRFLTDKARDGASHQPSTDGEPSNQPRTVAGQPQPQARGAWPLCDRCNKPMVTKGLGTALKPAHEPIVVARKPLIGTVAANVLKHGTGALNIDACRIANDGNSTARARNISIQGGNFIAGEFQTDGVMAGGHDLGRWPANLILSYPEDEYEVRNNLSAEQKRELYGWLGANA